MTEEERPDGEGTPRKRPSIQPLPADHPIYGEGWIIGSAPGRGGARRPAPRDDEELLASGGDDVEPNFDWSFRPDTYWSGEGRSKGAIGVMRNVPQNPTAAYGETLPELRDEEVEIALIRVASVMGDVMSVRVRRGEDGRLRYSVTDEYDSMEDQTVAQDAGPLSFREFTDLLWNAELNEFRLLRRTWEEALEAGEGAGYARASLSLDSEFYPELSRWYGYRFDCWIKEARGGRAEEASG